MVPLTSAAGVAVFLGDPVVDLLVQVDESFVRCHALEVGGCVPVDEQDLQIMVDAASNQRLPIRYVSFEHQSKLYAEHWQLHTCHNDIL